MSTTAPPVLPATTSSSTRTRPRLQRVRSRPALSLFGLLVVATVLAAIASALIAELGPAGRPHATLQRDTREKPCRSSCTTAAASSLRCCSRRGAGTPPGSTRHVGDLLVAVLVLANPVVVGFALGRYPTELPAYLPHLPLEYAALAIAASAWLTRRLPSVSAQRTPSVLRCATLTLIVTAIAAVVETYAVPHTG